jgi:hypothetical protein
MSVSMEIGLTVGQLALGAALTAGGRWVRRQVRTRHPASTIWSVNRALPVHIVTASDDTRADNEFTVLVYPAEYLAAIETRALVCEVLGHRDVTLWTSDDFPTRRLLSENVVSIGGPMHNRVTALLLERLNLPVEFDGYAVVSKGTRSRYEATVDHSSHRITRDVGVLVIDRNPFNPSCLAVLLMGSRTFGCPAASGFLTSGDLRHASRHLGPELPKWAILDVDVIDDFVASIDVLEASGSNP